MKNKLSSLFLSSVAASSILLAPALHAATYYWDNNGSNANFGTAAGTWLSSGTVGSATNGWGTNSAGTTAPTGSITTGTADSINFGTATASSLSAGNITVSGTVNAGDITFGSGAGVIALRDGTINLAPAVTITVNNTTDTISSILAGAATSFTKAGTGALILGRANTYTGATTISAGTLTLNRQTGSLSTTTPLTFSGTGTFNMNNVGASSALTQTLGALTFSAGQGTVQITRTAAFDQAITFASLTARTAGASGNFVNTGGVNSANNGFIFTSAPTADALIDRGLFYNGSAYATYDSGGFVRGFTTGDTGYLAAPTGTTIGASTSSSNVDLTGNITAQTTISANTINMRNFNIAMTGTSQVLSTKGLLSSGSAAATLGGGTTSLLEAGTDGGELVVRVNGSSDALNISSVIQNSASATSLTKSGAGTLILSGTNTYTGATTINAGTLTVSGRNAIANTGAVIVNSGAVLNLANGVSNGEIIGSIAGAGTVTLGSGGSNGGPLTVGGDNSSTTFSGVISGNGAGMNKSGTGTLTLTGVNTYTGTTRINAGTLNVTGLGTIAPTSNVDLQAGATLDFTGSAASRSFGTLYGAGNLVLMTNYTMYFGSGTSNHTFSGIISGGALLTYGGGGTTTLSGNNSYTSATTISKGALSINSISSVNGGASSLGNAATDNRILIGGTTNSGTLIYTGSGHSTDRVVVLSGTTGGATLDASGSGALVFSNAFTATGAGAKTLTLTGTNTADNRIGGAIVNNSGANTTSLTKDGTGNWVLSGANTYTGATAVNAGKLIINGTNTASAVTVTNTGTLGGSGSVGAVTVASGGTIDPGNSPGTLTVASSIWNDGGNYNWQLYDAKGAAGTGYDTITSTGSLNLSGLIAGGFNINLWTISSPSSTSGSAINFTNTTSYDWILGTFSGGITGFDANKININTGATNGTGGFVNTFTGGSFRISTNGSGQLLLNYQGAAAADSPVWIGGSGNLSTIGTTNGSALVFTGATGNVTNNQVSSLESMTFSNGAGAYNFSGNAVTNGSGGIVNNSAVTQTVSLALNLGTNQTFNAASGNLAISGNVTNNGNTLTLAGASNTDINGNITGAGGLTKTGAGTVTLNAAQSYTGKTTVSQGTVALGTGASLASTNINLGTLAGQGTLDVTAAGGIAIGVGQTLAGYGTVKGSTTIASGGTLAPGNSPGILTFNDNLTLNSGSTSIFEVAGLGGAGATNGFDQALVSGDLTYGGDLKISITGSYNNAAEAFGGNIFQFAFGKNTGNFTSVQYTLNGGTDWTRLTYYDASNTWQIWNDAFSAQGDNGYIGFNMNTGYLTVVPEPASWALFVGGVSTVLIFRRRKNS
jgi:autotransporter-associated beta strand protein